MIITFFNRDIHVPYSGTRSQYTHHHWGKSFPLVHSCSHYSTDRHKLCHLQVWRHHFRDAKLNKRFRLHEIGDKVRHGWLFVITCVMSEISQQYFRNRNIFRGSIKLWKQAWKFDGKFSCFYQFMATRPLEAFGQLAFALLKSYHSIHNRSAVPIH